MHFAHEFSKTVGANFGTLLKTGSAISGPKDLPSAYATSYTPNAHIFLSNRKKNYFKYIGWLLLSYASLGFSAYVTDNRDWVCQAMDDYYQTWSIKSSNERIAMNQVMEQCRRESRSPDSCHVAKELCEVFIDGKSTTPMWRCVAFDDRAVKWKSNTYSNQDDAALAALDYCKDKSDSPTSCYVHLYACKNLNKRSLAANVSE